MSEEQEPKGEAPATSQPAPANRSSYLKRLTTIRDRPSKLEAFIYSISCILLVLGLWHILTGGLPGGKRIIGQLTLPSPAETFSTFPSLWNDRALMRSIVWSLSRVLVGFLAGAAIAIPLGVIAGNYLRVDAFVRPLSVFGRSVPIAALIPLTIFWFKIGEYQKVMFILIASIAFVLFDTTRSVRGVSDRFLDTAYTLGARRERKKGAISAAIIGVFYALFFVSMVPMTKALSAGAIDWSKFAAEIGTTSSITRALIGMVMGFLLWYPIRSNQVISKVVFPLALPDIVNSLRLLFGLGFGYIILAEVIGAEYGLGKIIQMSNRIGPREHVYLCLIIVAVIAYAIDRLIFWCQKRWFPYREQH